MKMIKIYANKWDNLISYANIKVCVFKNKRKIFDKKKIYKNFKLKNNLPSLKIWNFEDVQNFDKNFDVDRKQNPLHLEGTKFH